MEEQSTVIDNVCNFGIFMPYKIIIFSNSFATSFMRRLLKNISRCVQGLRRGVALGCFLRASVKVVSEGGVCQRDVGWCRERSWGDSFNLYFQSTDANLLGKIDIYTFMNSIRILPSNLNYEAECWHFSMLRSMTSRSIFTAELTLVEPIWILPIVPQCKNGKPSNGKNCHQNEH